MKAIAWAIVVLAGAVVMAGDGLKTDQRQDHYEIGLVVMVIGGVGVLCCTSWRWQKST